MEENLMRKMCEKVINLLADLIFGKTLIKQENHETDTKDIYTLSSVFPTTSVMSEVKKFL